jgi:hypothetical protein
MIGWGEMISFHDQYHPPPPEKPLFDANNLKF